MKSLIALAAFAVFTVSIAVAGKPSAFATAQAIAAAKSAKPVMMASQELPFDRYRSKN
jgi:Flp pilus assembly protein CpaB